MLFTALIMPDRESLSNDSELARGRHTDSLAIRLPEPESGCRMSGDRNIPPEGGDSPESPRRHVATSPRRAAAASWVFVSPAKADRFLIRVTPAEGSLQRTSEWMTAIASGRDERIEVIQHRVLRKGGRETVVDVITTLSDVLDPEATTAEVMEKRLCAFVEPFLLAL